MNKLSLAYSNAQNQQQKTSWIDDPFDLVGFKGVKVLSRPHNLEDYAICLVSTFAKWTDNRYELTLEMLSDSDQLELARIYIESIDREIEWACYGEDHGINSDFLCAMLAMLKDNTEQTRQDFAEVTARNILISYEKILNEILDESCHTYYFQEMEAAGFNHSDGEDGDCACQF